jgi:hypothetical protein
MALYQGIEGYVNECISRLNPEALARKAAAGLLELSVSLGFEVVKQMMEAEVEAKVGPKGRHNAQRTAYRHGTEATKVVLGGQKVAIEKPRVRGKDGAEVTLDTLKLFQATDPLREALTSRMLNGVSTRKLGATLEAEVEGGSGYSKSTASRVFKEEMDKRVSEYFSRPLEE